MAARLLRLERAKQRGPRPDGEAEAADILMATASGAWTFLEWRVTLGEDQIEATRREISELARDARQARLDGLGPNLGTGITVAAEIVSYLPTEEVPPKYRQILQRYLSTRYEPIQFVYLVDAVLAAIILDTHDGIALRHELWCESENPGIS